jgi:F0F1-type ATP synthase membrane subunit c/vacuolar-type H+-ATPase subunit K
MPPPDYTGLLKLLYDWQTLITGAAALLGGLAAYVAGRIQASATREAADRQITAMARKDRLQARGIVVGVYPELLQLQVRHERASNVMAQWPSMRTRTMNTMSLVPAIRDVKSN